MKIENLKELLENNNLKELKNTLIEMNEYDIAEFLEELDEGEMIKVFRLLPKTIAVFLISFLISYCFKNDFINTFSFLLTTKIILSILEFLKQVSTG